MNEQVKQAREYFQANYPHIHIEDISDSAIEKYFSQGYVHRLPFEQAINLFSDFILSNGGQADE